MNAGQGEFSGVKWVMAITPAVQLMTPVNPFGSSSRVEIQYYILSLSLSITDRIFLHSAGRLYEVLAIYKW